jgi:drug/metabolite transporter (DMT)-like permease
MTSMATSQMYAVAAALTAAIVWAWGSRAYSVLAQSYSPFQVNSTRTAIGTVLFLIWFIVVSGGGAGIFDAPSRNWLWFAIAGFASFGVGDAFFLVATRQIPVSSALTIGATYPLVSSIICWFLEGELPALFEFMGVLTVCLGLIIVIQADRQVSTATRSDTNPRIGYALAGCAMLCWTLLSFAMVEASRGLSTEHANFLRVFVAFFVCLGAGRVASAAGRINSATVAVGGSAPLLPLSVIKSAIIVCVIEMGIGGYTFTYAYQNMPLPIAASLTSTHPFFAVLLGAMFGKEILSKVKVVGIVVVLAGIGMVLNS